MNFTVLQYNIFGRPYVVSHDGQLEREERIPEAILEIPDNLLDVDAATFAESDDSDERERMFQQFAARGYRYKTSVVQDFDSKSILNGGVVIGSKWPIVREDQIVYRNACSGSDCLAAKGVKYARIRKTAPVRQADGSMKNMSKIFNVFATHMQAWYSSDDKADRAKQAAQLKAFVDSQKIDPKEPVLFSGDFNTDWVRYPGEVAELVSILNASIPTLTGDVKFTSDPATNLLVGRDGAAGSSTFNCDDAYTKSWGPLSSGKTYPGGMDYRVKMTTEFPPKTDTGAAVLPFFTRDTDLSFCPCCPQEWLDYVLWSNDHQAPVVDAGALVQLPTLEAIALKLATAVRVPWGGTLQPVPEPPEANSYIDLVDLSDHYPVAGRMTFAVDEPADDDVQGCRQNSDCTFHWSIHGSCWCDGPGCTWDGKRVNGWQTGGGVNDNCHYHVTSLTCACHKDGGSLIKGGLAAAHLRG